MACGPNVDQHVPLVGAAALRATDLAWQGRVPTLGVAALVVVVALAACWLPGSGGSRGWTAGPRPRPPSARCLPRPSRPGPPPPARPWPPTGRLGRPPSGGSWPPALRSTPSRSPGRRSGWPWAGWSCGSTRRPSARWSCPRSKPARPLAVAAGPGAVWVRGAEGWLWRVDPGARPAGRGHPAGDPPGWRRAGRGAGGGRCGGLDQRPGAWGWCGWSTSNTRLLGLGGLQVRGLAEPARVADRSDHRRGGR
jgi:hypothetical protein